MEQEKATSTSSSTTGSNNNYNATGPPSGDSLSEDDCIIEMGAKGPSERRHKPRYSFQKRPFIIGVAGGTSSGKSTVCSKIMEKLGPIDPTSVYLSHEKRVVVISQDSFYRKLNDADRDLVNAGNFNFDHPEAFDLPRMVKTMYDILNGRMVKVPTYNYKNNEISEEETIIYPADVVLVEGLLLFYFPELRKMFNMKIFVDTDPDTRLSRRVMKDVQEWNRELDVVLTQYTKFVKPSFEEFCLPTKKYADIIVPRGPDNEVAVDLIVTHVRSIYDPSTRHESIKLEEFRGEHQHRPQHRRHRKIEKRDETNDAVDDDEVPVVRTAKEALRKSTSTPPPKTLPINPMNGLKNGDKLLNGYTNGEMSNGHCGHETTTTAPMLNGYKKTLKKGSNEPSTVTNSNQNGSPPKILVASCQ